MVDENFFLKSWMFKDVAPACNDVYPETRGLVIGRDPMPGNGYMVAWTDTEGNLHAFRKLQFTGGKLSNALTVELGQPNQWNVTIEQDDADPEKIKGTIVGPRGKFEANLAGTWGAEAPPPLTGGDGGSPRLRALAVDRPLQATVNGAAS